MDENSNKIDKKDWLVGSWNIKLRGYDDRFINWYSCLGTVYLVLCQKLFVKSVLKYTYTLKKILKKIDGKNKTLKNYT